MPYVEGVWISRKKYEQLVEGHRDRDLKELKDDLEKVRSAVISMRTFIQRRIGPLNRYVEEHDDEFDREEGEDEDEPEAPGRGEAGTPGPGPAYPASQVR